MAGLQELLDEIRDLQQRVAGEISREAEQFGYTLRQGRVRFEDEVTRRHKLLVKHVGSYLTESSLLTVLTAPVVYSLLLPLLLMDLFINLYQLICFPVYGIPRVRRRDYVFVDRQRLKYLNVIEQLNCMYCGYGNGLIAWAQEVAARTEQYWCPIKHARPVKTPHSRYYHFLPYGDAEGYAAQLETLRRQFDDLR